MPALPVNGIVEVRLNMQLNGQRLLNVFHYQNLTAEESSELNTALDYILTSMFGDTGAALASYQACCSDQLTFDYADAQLIYPGRWTGIRKLIGETGDIVDNALPQNVQAAVTKQPEAAGHTNRGRFEVAGLPITAAVNGLWTVEYRALMDQLAADICEEMPMDALGTNKVTPIIYTRTAPLVSLPWVTSLVQPTVRIDRRRTVGVGQ